MLKAVDVMYFVYYTDMDYSVFDVCELYVVFPDVYGRSDFQIQRFSKGI